MSISAVTPSPSTLTLLSQSTGSSGAQPTVPPSSNIAHAATFVSSIEEPVGSFNFKINGESSSTTISDSGGKFTATIPGIGTIRGSSEASVEAAIDAQLSEMA